MTDTIGNQKNDVTKLIDCPMNILEFQKMFPDEVACIKYLERMRWPDGFCCSKCAQVGEPFRIVKRPRVLKCRACLHETSITAGTVMHRSKIDILVWFWAAHLVSTQTPGISALELQKKLGIDRYETAFQMLHKLRSSMVRPNRDKIGEEWPLELDVVYVGGRTKSGISGKTSQTPVIIAVEVRQREIRDPITKKIKQRAQAGRIRLQKLPNKMAMNINQFAQHCIAPGASIVSDDGAEFSSLNKLGFKHEAVAMRGDKIKMDSTLPMMSVVTANLKTWIDGTFHGVIKKHLQAYLDEFMFRFNRRFYRAISFRSLLELGALTPGLTYKDVYGKLDAKTDLEIDIM
jgi:ISXO2-like transposase domain/Transposase zinc-ribbon domain